MGRNTEMPPQKRTALLLSGQNLAAGAVLGRTLATGTDDDGVADSGNTGDGTIGTVSAGTGAQVGTYTLTCTEDQANAGEFTVEDPQGNTVGVATVAVAFTGEVNFTIADGATDFVVGDIFRITVTGGVEKYEECLLTAQDGSEDPVAVLAQATDATSGDTACEVYTMGEFNAGDLSIHASWTMEDVRERLGLRGIVVRN